MSRAERALDDGPESGGDPAAVERELLVYAERARATGLDIVCHALEEREGGHVGRLTGVCVLGAYSCTAQPGEELSLPKADPTWGTLAEAWDAIEAGFDGDLLLNHPAEWFDVGQRLRAALNPRPARAS